MVGPSLCGIVLPICQAKGIRNLKSWRGWLTDSMLLVTGCFGRFGIRSFLLPNGFIDGGPPASRSWPIASSMRLRPDAHPGQPAVYFIGMRVIGCEFAAKAVFSITGLGLAVAFFPFRRSTWTRCSSPSSEESSSAAESASAYGRRGDRRDGDPGDLPGPKVEHFDRGCDQAVNLAIFFLAACCLSVEIALYGMLTYSRRAAPSISSWKGSGHTQASSSSREIQCDAGHDPTRIASRLHRHERRTGLGKRGLLKPTSTSSIPWSQGWRSTACARPSAGLTPKHSWP